MFDYAEGVKLQSPGSSGYHGAAVVPGRTLGTQTIKPSYPEGIIHLLGNHTVLCNPYGINFLLAFYPGCATRPWALESNTFGVTNLFRSMSTAERRPHTRCSWPPEKFGLPPETQRRARESNPQPLAGHLISSQAASQFAYPPDASSIAPRLHPGNRLLPFASLANFLQVAGSVYPRRNRPHNGFNSIACRGPQGPRGYKRRRPTGGRRLYGPLSEHEI